MTGDRAENQDAAALSTRPADAGDADADAVARVYLDSRRVFLPYAPLAHGDQDVRRWIADVLIAAGGVAVALAGSEVVGFVAVSRDRASGGSWIDQLYVAPGWTGRGVGSLLLKNAVRELDFPIRCYTFQANAGARRFYERHGFTAIKLTDGAGNEEHCPDALYERSA